MEFLNYLLVWGQVAVWVYEYGILEHFQVFRFEVNGRILLVHLPQGLQDPLVLCDDLRSFLTLTQLLHVSLHQPLDLLPPMCDLVRRLDHSRALKVDSFLNFLPFTFTYVVNGYK